MQRKIICFCPAFIFPFSVFCVEGGSWGCLELDHEPPGLSVLLGVEGTCCASLDACTTTCYIFTVSSVWQQEFQMHKTLLGGKGGWGKTQAEDTNETASSELTINRTEILSKSQGSGNG